MKKIPLTVLLACITFFAHAQHVKHTDVPQAVKDALYQMYPDATVAEWEMEDGNYEAEFDHNNVETSVVITPAGVHVLTETEIAPAALPQGARNYLDTKLGGKKITEACKITSAGGTVSYEAEVDGKDYLIMRESDIFAIL